MTSAENLKQLKIKTAMLKRLRKEYESYDQEGKSIQHKISQLEQQYSLTHDEEAETALRKHKQFLTESESVLNNVKQKLIEAFEGLAQFLSEKGELQGVAETQEKNTAENLVLEVETFLENLG